MWSSVTSEGSIYASLWRGRLADQAGGCRLDSLALSLSLSESPKWKALRGFSGCFPCLGPSKSPFVVTQCSAWWCQPLSSLAQFPPLSPRERSISFGQWAGGCSCIPGPAQLPNILPSIFNTAALVTKGFLSTHWAPGVNPYALSSLLTVGYLIWFALLCYNSLPWCIMY